MRGSTVVCFFSSRNIREWAYYKMASISDFTQLVCTIKSLGICDIRLPVTVSSKLNARQSVVYTSSVLNRLLSKPKQFLGSLAISKETPNTFNRFK